MRTNGLAQEVGREIGAGEHVGAQDFGDGVLAERMRADAHDVGGPPTRRPGVHRSEFRRQAFGVAVDEIDVGVHARREGRADRLGVGRIGRPFGLHVAAIEKQPAGVVLREKTGAEIGREQAQPLLAPEVDLPEAVARSVEALREEQIGEIFRADVRDAPAVDGDLGGGIETRNQKSFVLHGAKSRRSGSRHKERLSGWRTARGGRRPSRSA